MPLPIGVANELVMGQEGQAARAAAAGTEQTSWTPLIKRKTRKMKKHQIQCGLTDVTVCFAPSESPA